MAILAHSQQYQVKRQVWANQLGIGGCRCSATQLDRRTMNPGGGNRHMRQELRACHVQVARRIMLRHATLIAEEYLPRRPILRGVREQPVAALRRAATRKHNTENTVPLNGTASGCTNQFDRTTGDLPGVV